MNHFDILNANGNTIQLRCNNIIFNGTVPGSTTISYTLSGNVTQNGRNAVHAVYQPASWRIGTHPFNPVNRVRVNPLASGDVDVLID